MPRMAKSELQKFYDNIPAEVARLCKLNKIGIKKASVGFGMKYNRYNSRSQNPQKFSLEELMGIANYFNVSLFTLLGKDFRWKEDI